MFDDRHDLPAVWRYGVHLLTAILMLTLSPFIQQIGYAFDLWAGPFCILLLLVIAITAVINFTNMDGLDGLVAGCMAVLSPPL